MTETYQCDILFIGSGPHSLAVLSRLITKLPFSTYNDAQHHRILKWSSRGPSQLHKRNSGLTKHESSTKGRVFRDQTLGDIMVIDPSGKWMSRWKTQFSIYSIEYLRSPLTFHPDPSDEDALKSFAEIENRQNELLECSDLFNKSIKTSRKMRERSLFNERDRQNFTKPSSKLFQDFCDDLIRRNHFEDIVTKGLVSQIIPYSKEDGFCEYFRVLVCDPETNEPTAEILAKNIVCSIGFLNLPNMPNWAQKNILEIPSGRITHSKDLLRNTIADTRDYAIPEVELKMKMGLETRLVVVGGGLTSAHLCSLAQKIGYTKITLLCRSTLKVKHFDASLDWVGRYKNVEFSKFYSTSNPKERLKIIKSAREGGSLNPSAMERLHQLEKCGVLTILQEVSILDVLWNSEENLIEANLSNGETLQADQIWLATGCSVDVNKEVLFKQLLQKYPIGVVEGFPQVTQDLSWSTHCPNFYVAGGYAALQLGPNSLNLNGARAAGERIASHLLDKYDDEKDDAHLILGGNQNYFSMLSR